MDTAGARDSISLCGELNVQGIFLIEADRGLNPKSQEMNKSCTKIMSSFCKFFHCCIISLIDWYMNMHFE